MQIKLVLLTICASLVAIGFATPSPQGSRSGGELGFGIPNDEQSPGIDNLSLTGGSGESDEVMSLGDPDNESMAVLVRRRRRGAYRLRRNRLRKLRKMKKPPQAPSSI